MLLPCGVHEAGLVDDGQAAHRRLFIERWDVVAGLLHLRHDAVEVHAVTPVGEGRVEVSVECARRCVSVALDARYLHQAAHGVARQPQVVFQAHLGRVLDLRR